MKLKFVSFLAVAACKEAGASLSAVSGFVSSVNPLRRESERLTVCLLCARPYEYWTSIRMHVDCF